MSRLYFSRRNGRAADITTITLEMLLRLFSATYKDFLNRDYFQEAFGYHCVDAGFIPGIAGDDVGAYLFRKLRRDLWPIEERAKDFSEEDLFDVIEFLYDSVSKPVEGYYHHWDDCGWHYNTFDNQAGQKEFREEINDILLGYSDGYGLDAEGEIVYSGDFGLGELLDEQLPEEDPFDVHDKIKYAIKRFRHHRASIEDKQEAVRVLADVLEPLRSTVADLTTKKDAGDLFNIANNFAIRHNNLLQQADYDKNIYLKWIFYWYLATIHLALDVISQRE